MLKIRLIPCLDVKDGRVVKGVRFVDLRDAGVAAIVYTDIARDGILTGLNIPMTLGLARAVSIPVIASGGLGSMADIERLTEPDCAGLAGAISGRALYDGRIDAADALARLKAVRREGA